MQDRDRIITGVALWLFGMLGGSITLGFTTYSPIFYIPAIIFLVMYALGGILAIMANPYFEPRSGKVTKPFRILSGALSVGWLLVFIEVGTISTSLPATSQVINYVYIGVTIAFMIDSLVFYLRTLITKLSTKQSLNAEKQQGEAVCIPEPEPEQRSSTERVPGTIKGERAWLPERSKVNRVYCPGCGQQLPAMHRVSPRSEPLTTCPYCGRGLS